MAKVQTLDDEMVNDALIGQNCGNMVVAATVVLYLLMREISTSYALTIARDHDSC